VNEKASPPDFQRPACHDGTTDGGIVGDDISPHHDDGTGNLFAGRISKDGDGKSRGVADIRTGARFAQGRWGRTGTFPLAGPRQCKTLAPEDVARYRRLMP
jgi:hypothetical protein